LIKVIPYRFPFRFLLLFFFQQLLHICTKTTHFLYYFLLLFIFRLISAYFSTRGMTNFTNEKNNNPIRTHCYMEGRKICFIAQNQREEKNIPEKKCERAK